MHTNFDNNLKYIFHNKIPYLSGQSGQSGQNLVGKISAQVWPGQFALLALP